MTMSTRYVVDIVVTVQLDAENHDQAVERALGVERAIRTYGVPLFDLVGSPDITQVAAQGLDDLAVV